MSNIVNEIIQFLSELAEEEGMGATLFEAAKGGALAGVGAAAGGLLGGPVGLFIGAIAGGGIAAATCNDFEPLPKILSKMSREKKEILAGKVRVIMQRVNTTDVACFAAMTVAAPALRNEIGTELRNFMMNEMRMNVTRR